MFHFFEIFLKTAPVIFFKGGMRLERFSRNIRLRTLLAPLKCNVNAIKCDTKIPNLKNLATRSRENKIVHQADATAALCLL